MHVLGRLRHKAVWASLARITPLLIANCFRLASLSRLRSASLPSSCRGEIIFMSWIAFLSWIASMMPLCHLQADGRFSLCLWKKSLCRGFPFWHFYFSGSTFFGSYLSLWRCQSADQGSSGRCRTLGEACLQLNLDHWRSYAGPIAYTIRRSVLKLLLRCLATPCPQIVFLSHS